MKRILLFIAGFAALSATAQDQKHTYARDSSLSRWVIDVNFLGGGVTQTFTAANTAGNYLNSVNTNTGKLGFENGAAFGGDAQLGFFFGHNRHWGIGTGVLYLREMGNTTLDNFHVEYQSTDANGNTFRQLVTGNNINEKMTIDNFNIPLVLKYKARFSKHWGFAADAGALFNLQMKNGYNTNAAFDYEAIYKLNPNGDGTSTAVYDNSPIPADGDFLITKAQYIKNNQNGDVNAYFVQKQAEGYNVALGRKPNSTSGSSSYATGSVGFIFQPSVNYFFSDHVALNLGGYYIFQPFTNNANSNYQLTSYNGDYSSVTNSVTKANNQSYGVNVGLRFFLGGKHTPPVITSVDQSNPSACGACDGSLVLHGLMPGENVAVNYNKNGNAQPATATTVDGNGVVRLGGLCAGNYTDIVATVRRKRAMTAAVTLSDPVLAVSNQNSSNPSANGTCDGSITLSGLFANKQVTVSYNLNGVAQSPYGSMVDNNGSVTMSGLCAGTYSNIMVSVSNCTAKANDITLTAPPPPPPPAPPVVEEKVDISTPLLFNFNKATLHTSSYPTLDEASKEMDEHRDMYIRVDGYTDAIGSQKYNQKLSVRRAIAVKTYLKKKGVDPKHIKVVGHGKKEPAASNKTEEGRAKNRRAVMTPIDK